MTDQTGDAEATGITEAEASEAFLAMFPDEDTDGAETQGEEPDLDDDEASASDDVEDESDDEADGSDATDEQPALVTVKVDGEEKQVTLDEVVKGYQREADYTRKTMALGEERKALLTEKEAFAADRERTSSLLKALEERLAEPITSAEDMEYLRTNDPAEYAARVAEEFQRTQRLSAAQAERQRLEGQSARERAQADQELRRQEDAALLKALPEWSDPAVSKAAVESIRDYITALGADPVVLKEITDHKLWIALNDAAKYRALKSKTPQIRAKVDAVKAAKPGAASTPPSRATEVTRARQRLAETGSVDDAAALFMKSAPD